jgi:hypothetical protein
LTTTGAAAIAPAETAAMSTTKPVMAPVGTDGSGKNRPSSRTENRPSARPAGVGWVHAGNAHHVRPP